ncbi:hypothetical protein BRC63_07775 [Halobacteriales archaeon QH_10_70_21]|nr:MAG: hypothetical protein BRC63_07775 [Halobacteriales archaeon QH_10_70_21]
MPSCRPSRPGRRCRLPAHRCAAATRSSRLAVGADPAPITAAPLTGRDNVDVVTTSADTTFTVVNSIGEFPPATYDVSEATPGLDELVTETTTLTVEPAN